MLFLAFTSPLIVLLFLGLMQRYETWMLGDAYRPVVLLGAQTSPRDPRHRSRRTRGAPSRRDDLGGAATVSASPAPVTPVLVADLAPQALHHVCSPV